MGTARQVDSCSGSHALVRLAPDDDARYALDLSALKGRRVLIGGYTRKRSRASWA
jgi:hypothetical protein